MGEIRWNNTLFGSKTSLFGHILQIKDDIGAILMKNEDERQWGVGHLRSKNSEFLMIKTFSLIFEDQQISPSTFFLFKNQPNKFGQIKYFDNQQT